MDDHDAQQELDGPLEVAFVGDVSESSADMHDKLLRAPRGSELFLYFDSPGGSPYTAMSLMNLILMRELSVTAIVTGECSSAAIWPFAACHRRLVTPFSVLLFHPMRWQSEENVVIQEAREWARHFEKIEDQMDRLLAELLDISFEQLDGWMRPGRYLLGPELAAAGLAELVDPRTWRLPE